MKFCESVTYKCPYGSKLEVFSNLKFMWENSYVYKMSGPYHVDVLFYDPRVSRWRIFLWGTDGYLGCNDPDVVFKAENPSDAQIPSMLVRSFGLNLDTPGVFYFMQNRYIPSDQKSDLLRTIQEVGENEDC